MNDSIEETVELDQAFYRLIVLRNLQPRLLGLKTFPRRTKLLFHGLYKKFQ